MIVQMYDPGTVFGSIGLGPGLSVICAEVRIGPNGGKRARKLKRTLFVVLGLPATDTPFSGWYGGGMSIPGVEQ